MIRPLQICTLLLAFGFVFPSSNAQGAEHHILLTGQVMLQHNLATYDAPAFQNNPKLRKTMRDLDKVFAVVRKHDAIILELESALTVAPGKGAATGTGRDRHSDFFHEVDRDTVVDLIRNRIRPTKNQLIFTAANNHVGDNGPAGIAALLELFAELEVPMAGIGYEADASAARAISIGRDVGSSQEVALLAFATDKVKFEAKTNAIGVNTLSVSGGAIKSINSADEQRIYDGIGSASKRGATVIAYHHNHHWTRQKVNEASDLEQWRIDLARHCIDHGADVYFAHGEPRLQGIEIYRGKPIFYGLGNFVFQTRKVNFYQPEVWQSVLVDLEYGSSSADDKGAQRHIKSVKLMPVILNEDGADPVFFQTRGLPALAEGAQAINILTRLQTLSEQFGTRIEIDQDNPNAIFGRIRISN